MFLPTVASVAFGEYASIVPPKAEPLHISYPTQKLPFQ